MTRGRPVAGFPSVDAAIRGLTAQGLAPAAIAERCGVKPQRVHVTLNKDRRRAAAAEPAATRGWTPAKQTKALRLMALATTEIARALNVEGTELLALYFRSEFPPITGTPDPDFRYEPRRALPAPPAAPADDDIIEAEFTEIVPAAAEKTGAAERQRGGSFAWAESRIAELRALAGTLTIDELMARLKTGRATLKRVAQANDVDLTPKMPGYRGRGSVRGWTPEQDAELRRLAGTMPAKELGKRLGLTWGSLDRRARGAGVSLAYRGHGWRRKEIDRARLEMLAGTIPLAEIAAELGVGESTVSARAKEWGLSLRVQKATTLGRVGQSGKPPAEQEPGAAEESHSAASGEVRAPLAGSNPAPIPPPDTAPAPPAPAPAPRSATPVAGKLYRLEAAPGVWLHQSCTVTTDQRAYRWQGTARQLAAVREKHPFTKKFRAVEVVK